MLGSSRGVTIVVGSVVDEDAVTDGDARPNSWSVRRASVGSGAMAMHALLRLLVGTIAAALSTCHAPARVATISPPPPPRSAPPAQARVFDPDVVRIDPGSPVGRVRAELDSGDAEGALELARALLENAHGDERVRLAFLGGRAAHLAGIPVRSLELFAEVAATQHPLAPWARLERAQLLLETDAEAAVAEAAPLTEMRWAGRRDARDVHATALVRAGRGDEAEPLLRALLSEAPDDSARASVAMPLAELLAARDAPEAKVEAIQLWRRVTLRAPLSRAAQEADEHARDLLASLPADVRAEVGDPSAEEAMARGDALQSAMQFADAERAFAAVVASTEDPALRCRARLGEGRAIYYERDRARAAAFLAQVADDCDAPDVRAWARYLAGKAYAYSDVDRALEQYAALEREVPTHSLADDARFRAALIDAERGDATSMTDRLRTLPDAYPEGDMHGEARFLLAWRARKEGHLDEALSDLEASLQEGTGETAEDIRGRAAYWRACTLADLGRTDDAREAWTALVSDHPLSYYAQQALVRLGELGPAAQESARATLGARGDRAITFPWRSEMDTPAFARAIELLSVGDVERGRDELEWVYESSSDRDEELRWLEAALLDRAEDYPISVWLTRRHLRAFMEEPPSGENYARWRIAYPRAYAPLIDEAATQRELPPELVRAVAREESSFRADAVSVAHAYGLVQVILPTARRFGRGLGVRIDADSLRDPHVNVNVGAELMAWLWGRYEANPALIPSAYNAGNGATDRWLRERREQRLDEWIEDIPYDETRRYSRRVLQSWGIYAWLDRGELPELPAQLPR